MNSTASQICLITDLIFYSINLPSACRWFSKFPE